MRCVLGKDKGRIQGMWGQHGFCVSSVYVEHVRCTLSVVPSGGLCPTAQRTCSGQWKASESSVYSSRYRGSLLKSTNIQNLELQMISGEKAQISIIYYHHHLQAESSTPCCDSEPKASVVWWILLYFIYKFIMSQMIRFHQWQELYKFLHKHDLYTSIAVHQLRKFHYYPIGEWIYCLPLHSSLSSSFCWANHNLVS